MKANNSNIHSASAVACSTYHILARMIPLYRRLQKQEVYLINNLPVLLTDVLPGDHDAFIKQNSKRTTKYWQLGFNLICDNLYQLTGQTLHANEQQRIILLSVFGPLFDDLFDDKILDHHQITLLITHPHTYQPSGATDRFVQAIYLKLLELVPNKQLFTEVLQQVSYWQNESLKQLNSTIQEKELQKITYKKSYYAVLLYCAVLDHYPNQPLLDILYPVAGLMQLTNDAFDVYKDVHNGIYTLPNLYLNFDKLQQQFMAEVTSINQQLWQLPYPARAKRAYAITIHSLHAMGWMALEQLKAVTKGVADFEALKKMSRQSLVCDMDTFSQKVKWVRHIRRLVNYQG